MRILVTAGEPSGDLHAGPVIAALRRRLPQAEIEAVGGPRMAAAGAAIRHSIDGLSAMGLIEVLDKLPAHYRLLRALRRDFRAGRYDLVIPVDYPGFHFHLAEAAKRQQIPVLWYIAPQLWAWHRERAARLARAVDRLAVILPFESAFFQREGVETTYVGHPLADRVPPDRAAARAALGLGAAERVLALFPGSRRGEIRRLWPVYRAAAERLLAQNACDRVVVAATSWGEYPGEVPVTLVRDRPTEVLEAADAVLAKSGTTTLEAALAGVPMVVAYRMHPITYRLLRGLVTARWAALPNLIVDRDVVPELIQGAATVDALVATVTPLLDIDSSVRRAQLAGLAEVRERLGGPGASARVAALAEEMLVS